MTHQQYIAEQLAKKINEHFFGLSQEDINQKLQAKQVDRIDKTLLSRLKTATYTSLGPTTKAFKALAKYFDMEAPLFWEALGKGFEVVENQLAQPENGIRLALPSFTVWSTILVNPLINNWPDYLQLCVHQQVENENLTPVFMIKTAHKSCGITMHKNLFRHRFGRTSKTLLLGFSFRQG